ncbi:transcription factor E2F3 [Lampris incognitus]|uniref:transcription factor E2F3 n=1 Tax=Lampris incognitus TaxID=2546036 RepID=UPI0024B60D4C|nr:transcription factor E2F3 [Lampris incognitus]
MRRGVAVREKVTVSGVEGSNGKPTSSERRETEAYSQTVQRAFHPDHAVLVDFAEPTDCLLYKTPLAEPQTDGTGHGSEGGRTQAKRRLELDIGDHQYIQDVGRTSRAKRSPASLADRKTKAPKSPPDRTRFDTSLCLLTRKFLQLLAHSRDGVVDLNTATVELGVPKRRLYDITNVLEGVHLVKKSSKNNIQWLGCQLSVDSNQVRYRDTAREIQELIDKESKLDELIQSGTRQVHQLSQDKHSGRFAYLTHEDVKMIPSLTEQTVIVIKAPANTKLEVPHPDESLQVHLRSTQGPIEAFLCSDDSFPSDVVSGTITNICHSSQSNPFPDVGNLATSSSSFVKVSSQDGANHFSSSNGFFNPLYGLPQGSPSVAVTPTPPSPNSFTSLQPLTEDQQTFATLTRPLSLSLGGEDYLLSLADDEGITDLFSSVDLGCLPLQLI